MTNTISIELSYDAADELLVAMLKRVRKQVKKDIKRLEAQGDSLADYQQADLQYDKKLVKALNRVLDYYGH